MIENNKSSKKKIERIPLSKKSAKIVSDTLKLFSSKYPFLDISKKDLVNWIIEENFTKLNSKTEQSLYSKFYNPKTILNKAVIEAKRLEEKGEEIDLASLIPLKKTPHKSKVKKSTVSEAPTENTNKENI